MVQKNDTITMKQIAYAKKILQLGGMSECNTVKYPMEPKLKLSKDEGGNIVNAIEFHRMIGSPRYLTHT